MSPRWPLAEALAANLSRPVYGTSVEKVAPPFNEPLQHTPLWVCVEGKTDFGRLSLELSCLLSFGQSENLIALPFVNGFETREANRTLFVRVSALSSFQGGRANGFQAERFVVGLLIARSAELNGHGYNITKPHSVNSA